MNLNLIEYSDELVVLGLDGRMDANGLEMVEMPLSTMTAKKDVILDMCKVEYMASLGIRKLLQLAKDAKRNSKCFVILNPQSAVLGVLKLANLDTIIGIFTSKEDARKYIENSKKA